MSSLKRKGDSSLSAPPSKKQKKEEMESIDVICEVIPNSKDSIGPFVVTFPGCPPKNLLTGEDTDYTVSYSKKKSERRVEIDTDSVRYIGNVENENSTNDLSSYFMVIYNKNTSKAQIVPIEKPLKMKTIVKTVTDSVKKYSNSGLTKLEQKALVLTNMGTAKAKSSFSKIYQNNLATAIINEEQIEKQQKNSELLQKTQKLEDMVDLPPLDRDTSDPSKIYQLKLIVTDADLLKIKTNYINYLKNIAELDSDEKAPRVVKNCITLLNKKYQNADEKAKNLLEKMSEKCKILQWLFYMMQFYKEKRFLGAKSATIRVTDAMKYQIPANIFETLMNNYCEITKGSHGGRIFLYNKVTQVKLLRHILAIILTCTPGCIVDINDMSEDLGEQAVNLTNHFQILGCRIQVAEGTKLAALKAPYKMVGSTFGGGMRRKKR